MPRWGRGPGIDQALHDYTFASLIPRCVRELLPILAKFKDRADGAEELVLRGYHVGCAIRASDTAVADSLLHAFGPEIPKSAPSVAERLRKAADGDGQVFLGEVWPYPPAVVWELALLATALDRQVQQSDDGPFFVFYTGLFMGVSLEVAQPGVGALALAALNERHGPADVSWCVKDLHKILAEA